MATYKVLQDIEAEDKFFGPLTLKQCIFAAIAIVGSYLSFLLISRGVWVMALPMIPIIIITGFLAFPWGRDQPTETWLLAKIRFMFKPRKRIWDQTGIQELVKITAPPKVEEYLGDNLSQTEVKSRLKALADTIDSRGWAIKNTGSQLAFAGNQSSDRLVGASTLPPVAAMADEPSTDMFDSPLAAQITSQISATSAEHKATTVSSMQDSIASGGASPANNLWFMSQPADTSPGQATFATQTVTALPADDTLSPLFSNAATREDPSDALTLDKIRHKHANQSQVLRNHKAINPVGEEASLTVTPPVTAPPTPATIELARNNDRTVESLAREAGDGEIVVPLH